MQVEIESKLKCFIPEFMPAIGSLDNFVKVFVMSQDSLADAT